MFKISNCISSITSDDTARETLVFAGFVKVYAVVPGVELESDGRHVHALRTHVNVSLERFVTLTISLLSTEYGEFASLSSIVRRYGYTLGKLAPCPLCTENVVAPVDAMDARSVPLALF